MLSRKRMQKRRKKIVDAEPMYDCTEIEDCDEQDTARLIWALLDYVKELEAMVVDLRSQVNRLTPANEQLPYCELHSDIYHSFYDYPAYERFEWLFQIFDQY